METNKMNMFPLANEYNIRTTNEYSKCDIWDHDRAGWLAALPCPALPNANSIDEFSHAGILTYLHSIQSSIYLILNYASILILFIKRWIIRNTGFLRLSRHCIVCLSRFYIRICDSFSTLTVAHFWLAMVKPTNTRLSITRQMLNLKQNGKHSRKMVKRNKCEVVAVMNEIFWFVAYLLRGCDVNLCSFSRFCCLQAGDMKVWCSAEL